MEEDSGRCCSSASKEAAAEEEEDGWFNRFPEELLQQVLCYLPLPEMIRARMVCRSWRSALTSPAFLPLWSRRASPSLCLLRYHSLDSTLFAFHPLSKTSLLLPRPSCPPLHSIVASSQGVICFRHTSYLALLNPLTRLSLPIPPPISMSPFFIFGFTHQRFHLHGFYMIACDFSQHPPSSHAELYDSAVGNWVLLPPPPVLAPPSERLPRSTQEFVWWNGKFCLLLSSRVVTYDVHSSQWGSLDLPSFPRMWDSRYMTLHAIRGRLFLEGNFQSRGYVHRRDPLLVGILELDPTTLQWKEKACMPEEFSQLLCNDAQPLHSKYTSYSDADCDHMCFSPHPTPDKEHIVFYYVEENSWTSMQIYHRNRPSYFASSNFKGWALQPSFTALA